MGLPESSQTFGEGHATWGHVGTFCWSLEAPGLVSIVVCGVSFPIIWHPVPISPAVLKRLVTTGTPGGEGVSCHWFAPSPGHFLTVVPCSPSDSQRLLRTRVCLGESGWERARGHGSSSPFSAPASESHARFVLQAARIPQISDTGGDGRWGSSSPAK